MGNHLAKIDIGRKLGAGRCAPFSLGRGAGSPFNTMWPGPRPTFVPSGILIHPAVWPQYTWAENWEALPPFLGRGAGTQLAQSSLGRGLPPAIWPQQIWDENWGLCPFGVGGSEFPFNTMWPGPRPASMPSFILIRPIVWPCTIHQRHRQDRQTDRQT